MLENKSKSLHCLLDKYPNHHLKRLLEKEDHFNDLEHTLLSSTMKNKSRSLFCFPDNYPKHQLRQLLELAVRSLKRRYHSHGYGQTLSYGIRPNILRDRLPGKKDTEIDGRQQRKIRKTRVRSCYHQHVLTVHNKNEDKTISFKR